MSGSGYAIGLAIASYEWMAALTLIIVGKWFLPIFLANRIYTMPQFLEQRYGTRIRTLMAVFWLALYIFVNLTSIIWLGSIAVTKVAGVDQTTALVALGGSPCSTSSGADSGGRDDRHRSGHAAGAGRTAGVRVDVERDRRRRGSGRGVQHAARARSGSLPHDPHRGESDYKDLPGLSVLIGGMWIANLSYWGFNQYIIQRALAAKSLSEAQKGVIFAAYLKLLMPVIIVLPGIAAVILAPDLARPDEAYPTMMRLLPAGIVGLVFAALIAAIVASTASKINSVATIFTLDIYSKIGAPKSEARLVASAASPLSSRSCSRSSRRDRSSAASTRPSSTSRSTQASSRRGSSSSSCSACSGSAPPRPVRWRRRSARSHCPSHSRRVAGTAVLDRMGVVFVLACARGRPVADFACRRAGKPDPDRRVGFRTSAGFNIGAVGVIVS